LYEKYIFKKFDKAFETFIVAFFGICGHYWQVQVLKATLDVSATSHLLKEYFKRKTDSN